MNEIYTAWLTFVTLSEMLIRWAELYVPPARAGIVVRRVLARSFRMACNDVDTPMGPWDWMVEQVSYELIHEVKSDLQVVSGYPSHFAPVPTAMFLRDLCSLWALVFAAKAHAQWGTVDIDEVYMLIRSTDPQTCSIDDLRQKLTGPLAASLPIRRAFTALLKHDCPFTLICTITDDIIQSEVTKSLDWRRQHAASEE